MTTYTAIANADIDQDSPITQELMTLNRDNPIAISEGSTGAPVMAAGWHPYDMVTVGDGNDGKFYDFSTDGATSSVITPDFEDGYEYLIRYSNISHDGSLGSTTITWDLYKESAAAYATVLTSGAMAAGDGGNGLLLISFPRVSTRSHTAEWIGNFEGSGGTHDSGAGTAVMASDDTILKVRMYSSSPIDAGTAYLYRRREYISG